MLAIDTLIDSAKKQTREAQTKLYAIQTLAPLSDTTAQKRLSKAEAYLDAVIDLLESAEYQVAVALWTKNEMSGEEQMSLFEGVHHV